MDITLEKLQDIIAQITREEYGTGLIVFLFIFFVLYTYLLSRQKKTLRTTLENNLKVFQKAFDISDDAILILSDKNKVMYANNSMFRLLQLNNDFLFKTLETPVQVKVKKDWIALDQFIEENRVGPNDKVSTYPQSILKITEGDEIPVNIFFDTIVMRMPNKVFCNLISIQNMTKEKERSGTHFRHQLTNLYPTIPKATGATLLQATCEPRPLTAIAP